MIDLGWRAVVVTGATGNLGATVTRRYLEAGAHVAIAARDLAKGEALRGSLGERAVGVDGPKLIVVDADPADAAAMDRLVETVLRTWGRLDVLANLAGGFGTAPATDLGKMRELWEQNVATAVTAAAACLRPMRARKHGRIVSVAAQSALKGGANASGYAMAKGAIARWTESLAAEVKAEGITVNAVLPGTIDHPLNRERMPKADPKTWVSPDEVASVILFLSSDQASGVNGALIPLNPRA